MPKKSNEDTFDTDAATPEKLATEDKTKQGWPGVCSMPFVSAEYYDQFPERFRPTFKGGAPAELSMSVPERDRVLARFERAFPMKTFVNMSLKVLYFSVAGPSPDAYVNLKIPPFGVIRGDPSYIQKQGVMGGSKYWRFYPVSAVGSCGRSEYFTCADGRKYETCKWSDCPHHPMGEDENRVVHSIQHGLHFISSIGEALMSPEDPERAGYIPEDPRHQLEQQLWAYNEIDVRPACNLFSSRRMKEFQERVARRSAARQDGKLGDDRK